MAASYYREAGTKDYTYKGKHPYSAGDLFTIDAFVGDDFTGNAVEQLINTGVATYDDCKDTLTIKGAECAIKFVD